MNLLLDEFRVDNYHNHKIYLDPTSGIFKPIVWDLMPFMNRSLELNNDDSNLLFSKINRIPQLVERRNKMIKEIIDNIPETSILDYIDNYSNMIDYEMRHDKFKDAYDAPWILSYDDWKASLDQLKIDVHNRYSFLKERLDDVTVALNIINDNTFIFDVKGESGIIVSNILIEDDSRPLCYSLYKDMDLDGRAQESEKIVQNCSYSIDFYSEKIYPGKNDTLRYRYILKTIGNVSADEIIGVSIHNSVTGKKISPIINILDSEEQLQESSSRSSIHSWLLYKRLPKKTVLEGEVSLNDYLIIEKDDMLVIKPGTTIRFAPGASIISYGKIIAEGTKELPINFISQEKGEPWGAIVLQGEGTDGSYFKYCNFEEGSGAKYELVHYTGMLSAYNSDIKVDNCRFDSNRVEDDTYNSKYSNSTITNSEFTNTLSDAIDFDISTGIIENTKFYDIGGDAIDIMASTPLIKNNFIENAEDKGISIGEQSNPIILNNTIISSNTGMAIKDLSNPLIINNTLRNNEVGIAAYEKNWRYGSGGRGYLINNDICMNTRPILLQNLSLINIEHNGRKLECTIDECDIDCGTDSIH